MRGWDLLAGRRFEFTARIDGAPAWVPWPTSNGFWWGRARPGADLTVVEARVYPEGSCIYFTGVECPLYVNEPREAWEFTPAVPPRMGR